MTRVRKEETQTDLKSNKSKRTSKNDSSGSNKVAKYGAAVASVLAVSIALFGS
jgi:hypothetical protein